MTTDLPTGDWSEEVHGRLVGLLASPPPPHPPVAVFDFDDTVTAGDSSIATMRLMDADHGTRWHDTYFELLESHGREVAYPQIPRWFAGHTPESYARLARDLADRMLASRQVRFRPEIVSLMAAMRAGDWEIWVVSASPAPIVRELAGRVGVAPERVLAMELVPGDDGRYLDEVVEPATFCGGKQRAIERAIRRQVTLALGDSRSDADMMHAAQHALLLDGHDVTLRADAVEAGWWVQSGWYHTPAEPGVLTDAP